MEEYKPIKTKEINKAKTPQRIGVVISSLGYGCPFDEELDKKAQSPLDEFDKLKMELSFNSGKFITLALETKDAIEQCHTEGKPMINLKRWFEKKAVKLGIGEYFGY